MWWHFQRWTKRKGFWLFPSAPMGSSRDPRTKTDRYLGPNRTRTEKFKETKDQLGPGPTKFLKISDQLGPIGPRARRSVDPWARPPNYLTPRLARRVTIQITPEPPNRAHSCLRIRYYMEFLKLYPAESHLFWKLVISRQSRIFKIKSTSSIGHETALVQV